MECPNCAKEMRMFSDKKLDFRRYKKYKCDRCKQVTELEIDNRDRVINVNRYRDKIWI